MQSDQVRGGLAARGLRPDPTEVEWQAMTLHLVPAVGALVTVALTRSGATKDDMEQERERRRAARGRRGIPKAMVPSARDGDEVVCER